MPIEENWFNYGISDVLYGFMQASATYNPNEKDEMKKLYYSKKQYNKDIKIIKTLLGCKDKRTVTSKIKRLVESAYIAEDSENYYFPYDANNFYLLVDKELLYYICTTMSAFALKTYVYLGDKARMKPNYHFTIKELRVAFGYSSNSQNAQAEKIIGSCLDLLSKAGLLKYHKEMVKVNYNDDGYECPNFVLDYVATTLPKDTQETLEEMENDCKCVDYAVSDYMAEQKPVFKYFDF